MYAKRPCERCSARFMGGRECRSELTVGRDEKWREGTKAYVIKDIQGALGFIPALANEIRNLVTNPCCPR